MDALSCGNSRSTWCARSPAEPNDPLRSVVSISWARAVLARWRRENEERGKQRFLSLWETFVQVVPFQQVSLAPAIAIEIAWRETYGPHAR